MNVGAATARPSEEPEWWRDWCLGGALVVLVVALVPPFSDTARHTEYGEALQFSLLALVVPALLVFGAPWRRSRLSGKAEGLADRIAKRRMRHRQLSRSLGFIVCDLAVVVAWRTPAAVAASTRHGSLTLVEAGCLLLFGVGLWLELVISPPLIPRSGHLRCAVLAAFAMWAFWILAYVSGLSTHDYYGNFHHVRGGLSAAADQQIASAILWLVSALSFAPLIFWNAFQWLKTEEDPDTELLALARDERRRGTPT